MANINAKDGVVFLGTLKGAQEAIAKCAALDRSMEKRIIRKGIRKASAVAAKIAKHYAPKDSGTLGKSMGWRLAKAKPGIKRALGIVGARRRFLKVVDGRKMVPTKYQHLVNLATKAHAITPKGETKLAPKKGGGFEIAASRLAFNAFGRLVVVSKVSHPGTRATDFLGKAQRAAGRPALATFTGTVNAELHIQAAKAKPSEVDDG